MDLTSMSLTPFACNKVDEKEVELDEDGGAENEVAWELA